MIQTRGNDIYRGNIKIGWLNGDHVYNSSGKLQGYFSADTVFDPKGNKLAHIDGDYVYAGSKKIPLENAIGGVDLVGLGDAARLAISTFFGF